MECVKCKAWIEDYVSKCPHCGMEYHPNNLNSNVKLCRNCHAGITEDDVICQSCGFNLSGNKTQYIPKEKAVDKIHKKCLMSALKISAIAFLILMLVLILSLILIFKGSAQIELGFMILFSIFFKSIFYFISIFSITLGIVYLYYGNHLEEENAMTDGKVIDHKIQTQSFTIDNLEYYPIIEYTVNEKTYRCVSKQNRKTKIGKMVKVIYKKGNPIESIHNVFIDIRVYLLILFGIIFLILCNIDLLSI